MIVRICASIIMAISLMMCLKNKDTSYAPPLLQIMAWLMLIHAELEGIKSLLKLLP